MPFGLEVVFVHFTRFRSHFCAILERARNRRDTTFSEDVAGTGFPRIAPCAHETFNSIVFRVIARNSDNKEATGKLLKKRRSALCGGPYCETYN